MSNDLQYEYSRTTKLSGDAAYYFVVPEEIIFAEPLNTELTAVFSFFSIRRGLDRIVPYSVNNIVIWMGKKPNRNKAGINNRIKNCVQRLIMLGYLSECQHTEEEIVRFELSHLSEICGNSCFATIYVDELKMIMEWKCPEGRGSYPSNEVLLLVFAFFRLRVFRRNNKLNPEEINVSNRNNHELDIQTRRFLHPEAYDDYYYRIAEKLGIPTRTFSKAVAVLKEMGLLYYEVLPHFKNGEEWRSDHTIFCNTYKRQGSLLLDAGDGYINREIANKKAKLSKYRKQTNKNNQP